MKLRIRNLESDQIEYVDQPESPRIEVTHVRPAPIEPIRYYPDDLTAFYLGATVGPQPIRICRPVRAAKPPNKVLWVSLAGLIVLVSVLTLAGLAALIAGQW